MMIDVTLTQFDMLEGTRTVVADGPGTLDGDTLVYHERGDEKIVHEVIFLDDEIVLKRKGGFGSVTHLYPDRKGTSRAHSPYGIMELDTVMIRRDRQDDTWTVEYMITANGETLTHQTLVWEMKGAAE